MLNTSLGQVDGPRNRSAILNCTITTSSSASSLRILFNFPPSKICWPTSFVALIYIYIYLNSAFTRFEFEYWWWILESSFIVRKDQRSGRAGYYRRIRDSILICPCLSIENSAESRNSGRMGRE